ncbi:MAG: Asp-tRNA(Asn)/Glu-tRNA(Gln) amidotransferase subunit GatC [Usitatibacter sp.]
MLSLEQISRLADLARLELSGDEARALRAQLNDILAMVDRMAAVDTAGVDPMSHPQEVMQRLREDVVSDAQQRDSFQEGAPHVEDGFYLVPKVIE